MNSPKDVCIMTRDNRYLLPCYFTLCVANPHGLGFKLNNSHIIVIASDGIRKKIAQVVGFDHLIITRPCQWDYIPVLLLGMIAMS